MGALFIAAVFLLLTMAILALKTLSSLADDRKRYEILSRLGADRRTQCKTLQRQTFWFFLLPFAVPVLTSFPVAMVCRNLMRIANQPELLAQIPVIAAAVLVTMVLVYLLYYAATYLIAKKTVIGQPW